MHHRPSRLLILLTLISGLFSGCSKPQPILSGGKPPSYWVRNVSSPDKKLRKTAVMKLGNAGTAAADVVPALVGALHDADAQVRREAIFALCKVGPQARKALPELETMCRQDRDGRVRTCAARAVEKLR
jgi:HEAT repeat protein